MQRTNAFTLLTISAALLLCGSLATVVVQTASLPSDATKAESPPQLTPQSGYLGSDSCVVCHENYDATITPTKHGFKANERTPMAQRGCESCHGPGEAHASDPEKIKPTQFQKVSPSQANAQCQTCHNRGEHALWDGSQHENRNLKCIDCHSVHSSDGPTLMRKKTQQLTCARCHQTITNKQQRFNHMPVREGKMTCVTCHNPHGSSNVKQLRAGNYVNESCFTCHAEKRGPFLWDHAAGREACSSCHDPHGSTNDRMLVAKQPVLCQRCHIGTRHPSTIYDGTALANRSNRLVERSCTNCHQQIHGSNHPSGMTFLR
jgi:DmsE family decaheme c-type cytochrome